MDTPTFRRIKFFFNAFGFESHKWFSFIIFFNLLFACSQFVFIFLHRDSIFYTSDMIGNVSDNVKFLLSFATHFVAIYVSWRNGRNDGKLSRRFACVRSTIVQLNVDVVAVDEKMLKNFLRKLKMLLATQFMTVAQEVFFQYNEPQTMRWVAAFTFVLTFGNLKNIHVVFYLDLINAYSRELNNQLENLSELIKFNELNLQNRKYNKFLYNRLKLCRDCHALLYEIIEIQNESTGCLLLINYLSSWTCILSSLYWIVFRIINQHLYSPISKNSDHDHVRINVAIAFKFQRECRRLLSKYFLVSSFLNQASMPGLYQSSAHFTCTKLFFRNISMTTALTIWYVRSVLRFLFFSSLPLVPIQVQSFSLEILSKPVKVSALGVFNVNNRTFKSVSD